ncbi:MAG: alpha-glucosidase [Lewinella sp.]
METKNTHQRTWWKEGIVHQIYPRSYQDTNGDGVGDLRGIIQRLDYIKSLGVDIVWLNPIYASPNDDNGYDISDYRAIMSDFGTMEDFDELLAEMHERGLKLVMDLVVNHSSDEHEWFVESRKNRDNPYRDYYHWWPAEKGKPNPRWSFFDVNSDAWMYDETTDAYYLHYFSRKQPDLNWENPKVREEVKDIMRFWLDKGIDGFRMDAFQVAAKDISFPELPKGYEDDIFAAYGMQPGLHDYLREINRDVTSQYDVFTVAEGAGSTMQDAIDLSDPARKELDMVYHFEISEYVKEPNDYDFRGLKSLFTKWDRGLADKGWNSIFLANHDIARMVSRYGNDDPEYRIACSKCLNTLLMTMRGTPFTYYGDELGMTNINFQRIEQYQDIEARNGYLAAKQKGEDMTAFMARLNAFSRDNSRTPMQWTAGENASFTTGKPWLEVNPNHTTINVEDQDKDPASCLNYFRKLTAFRKANPLLVYGNYTPVAEDSEQLFAYVRELDGKQLLVAMNWSEEAATLTLPEGFDRASVVLDNLEGKASLGIGEITLVAWQAVVLDRTR